MFYLKQPSVQRVIVLRCCNAWFVIKGCRVEGFAFVRRNSHCRFTRFALVTHQYHKNRCCSGVQPWCRGGFWHPKARQPLPRRPRCHRPCQQLHRRHTITTTAIYPAGSTRRQRRHRRHCRHRCHRHMLMCTCTSPPSLHIHPRLHPLRTLRTLSRSQPHAWGS